MLQYYWTFIAFLFVSIGISAQNIGYTFDNNERNWTVKQGKAEIQEKGAYKEKSLKLNPGTSVSFNLKLKPSSTYKLTVWMRTESGADDLVMQINDLGKNNISITTALAAWTKFEEVLNTSNNQSSAQLEFIFGNSQGNTNAWIDEITIEYAGNYKEVAYTGIPKAPKREIKTD